MGWKAEQTRARIRHAAADLFAQHGYAATTLQAVATSAGVAKGLPSHHFKTKARLLDAVLEDYYTAHVEALKVGTAGYSHPRERVHALLDAYFDFIADHGQFPRLVQRVSDQASVRDIVRRHMQPVLEWVEEMLADLCASSGPTAGRHFFLTFSAVVINYFTYAPLVLPAADDGLAEAMISERRRHLHWLGDACIDALEAARSDDGNSPEGDGVSPS